MEAGQTQEEIRKQAVDRLESKRALRTQIGVFVLVAALLIVIWAATSDGGFFWPIFPIAGFAIALIAQGWGIYGPGSRPISEAEIQRESDRLQR